MRMKKLISLGVVSAMVASISPAIFATIPQNVDISKELKAYVFDTTSLSDSETFNLAAGQEVLLNASKNINGQTFDNVLDLSGINGAKKVVVFGVSKTCPLGKNLANPQNLPIVQLENGTSFKAVKNTFFNVNVGDCKFNTGIKVSHNYGGNPYSGAAGLKVEFKTSNMNSEDKVGGYTLTLRDNNNHTKDINIIMTAVAGDKTDTTPSEYDPEDGARPYNGGTLINKGYIFSNDMLKAMSGKGPYRIFGSNGIIIQASVSGATVNEGQTSFDYDITIDSKLSGRYDANGEGKIARLAGTFLHLEQRMVGIDCDNSYIRGILGSDFCDKCKDGLIKKLWVYPINAKGYDALADASGNDGLIDTANVIQATVKDEKIQFTLPKDVTDVMISLKEIDTTKLPAIPGVSIPEDETSANEIEAPVLDTTSEVVEPAVVEAVSAAPVLETAPATVTQQANTGASDVVVVAIALAAISMLAAGAVASKKF